MIAECPEVVLARVSERHTQGWEAASWPLYSWTNYTSQGIPCFSSYYVLFILEKKINFPNRLEAKHTLKGGLQPQLHFHILFNGLLVNRLSMLYQQHWSSCSRKSCALEEQRLLASFLHKRVWLNQRGVWLPVCWGWSTVTGWWRRWGWALWSSKLFQGIQATS